MVREFVRKEGSNAVRERFNPLIIYQSTIKLLSSGHGRRFISPGVLRSLVSKIRNSQCKEVIFHLNHVGGKVVSLTGGVFLIVNDLIEIPSYDPVAVLQK